MVVLLVMLAKEIFAVVVAVRRANDGMNVATGGLVVGERDPGLVVELDQDDRAVDAVVEDAVLLAAAHPGEVGLLQVLLHLDHLGFGVAGAGTSDVRLDQTE